MTEKYLIFDASSLISLSMNGLLGELKDLKKIFNGKFIITEEVKEEVIDRPMGIKKFELEALNINRLLNEKIIELPSSIGIKKETISKETKNVLKTANSIFSKNGQKEIHIIDSGEAACLALSQMLTKESKQNIVVVDERTTRLLSEKPENLRRILEKKIHVKVEMEKEYLKNFKNTKIVRSAELMHLAYKKGLTGLKNGKALDAILYALKYKGCAISSEEIEKLKRIK